ncbi:MAG: hypothetical protein QM820_09875 [Minicystis sp.]
MANGVQPAAPPVPPAEPPVPPAELLVAPPAPPLLLELLAAAPPVPVVDPPVPPVPVDPPEEHAVKDAPRASTTSGHARTRRRGRGVVGSAWGRMATPDLYHRGALGGGWGGKIGAEIRASGSPLPVSDVT